MSDDHSYSFDHVFERELVELGERLDSVARDSDSAADGGEGDVPDRAPEETVKKDTRSSGPPSVSRHLVGLSFSGGGIRSASFHLGVAQGLHKLGVLPHVDYLSTVSGGGYIGGAISALMRGEQNFPFAHGEGPTEKPAVTYVRDHANYLVPGGFVDAVRLVVVIIRGAALNLLLVAPWLIWFAALTSLYFEDRLRGTAGDAAQAFYFTPWLLGLSVLWVVLSPIFTGGSWRRETRDNEPPGARYGERNRFERSFAWLAIAVGVSLFVEIQPLFIWGFHELGNNSQDWVQPRNVAAAAGSLLSVGAAGTLGAGGQLMADRLSGRTRTILLGILGPLVPILAYIFLVDWLVYDGDVAFEFVDPITAVVSQYVPVGEDTPELSWSIVGLFLFAYGYFFVDVNQHSGHPFWRDRLASSFLIGRTSNAVQPLNALRMTEMRGKGSVAPYHLLGTTLNLQGDRTLSNSGRRSTFFTFSKHFAGSDSTGYIPMSAVESNFPHVDLATAMAISSAAASPNMGAVTKASTTILLTLLNARMGFWFPHPTRLAQELQLTPNKPGGDPLPLRGSGWRPGPSHLLREAMGNLHASGQLINLSDGGHLENLGVYQLLRRRCKFIIAGDAEADPQYKFEALGALVRFARIDLGVEVDIHVDNIRNRDERDLGKEHCALGKITYPSVGGAPEETGWLLYVKSSLTGNEDAVVTQYKALSETFPQESTADQFFNEQQFEAYRALGFHIVTSVMDEALSELDDETGRHAELSFPRLNAAFEVLRHQLASGACLNEDGEDVNGHAHEHASDEAQA
jgi:hypothetical protein